MSRKVVGDVAVRVGADVGPLKIGLQDGARSVGRFERSGSRSAKKLARNVRNIALAASAMAGALAVAGRRAAAELDTIGKKSAQLGITAEALQEISFAAKSAGVSTSGLQSSMERFSKRLGEAEQGFGAAKKQLEFLGIAAEDLTAMPLDEALGVIADRMQGIEDPTTRAAVAAGLFGREGVAMVNMLKDGGDALAQTRREARDFGAVVSNETVAAAEELQDKLGRLGDGIKSQLNEALIEVGPLLIEMAEAGREAALFINETAEAVQDLADAANDEGLRGFLDVLTGGAFKRAFPAPYNPNATEGDVNANSGLSGEELLPPPQLPVNGAPAAPNDEGGGGGGGTSRKTPVGPTQEDLERLKLAFATQREIITDAYERDLEELEKFRQAGIAKEEELNALQEKIHQDHLDRLAEMDRRARSERLSDIGSAFGDLAGLMQSENDKLFAIGKAAAIAEATVSGYRAAVSAWEKGMSIGGPPVAAAFTAASLAKTGALISSISSQGSRGGGSQSNPGGGAGAQPARTSQAAVIQLEGEIFGRDQIIKLVNGINEAVEDGAIVRLA